MNCHECRQWLDDFLVREPGTAPTADVARHLTECRECAGEHALALETLAAIAPRVHIAASPRLKQRLLALIPAAALEEAGPAELGRTGQPHLAVVYPAEAAAPRVGQRRVSRARLAMALAAAVLLVLTLFPLVGVPGRLSNGRAWSLLREASAAEARFFAVDRLVGLTNEIVVEPVDDAELIAARWLPLIAIGADGKPRFHQLKLAGEPGRGYTVRDQSWYDPATRRFARVLSLDGRPLFANAFDGRAVHLLEVDEQGRLQVKDEPVTSGFQPPKDPAAFLGIAAGLTTALDRPDQAARVRDEGPIKLADGTPGRAIRLYLTGSDASKKADSYSRAIVRDDRHTLESMELIVRGRTLLRVQLAKAGESREPEYGWDLASLRPAVRPGGAKSPVLALANLVRPNISVEAMAKRADYATYVLAKNPSWAPDRQIMDILDLPSPPHRMFVVVYPAKDKRHVVLAQAYSFNEKLGPAAHAGKLVYTSPQGVKVWSGKQDQWLAEILLSSARASIADPPAKDRTGYMLETPEKTFPVLAVNGTLTEPELHDLVDSLVSAKPK